MSARSKEPNLVLGASPRANLLPAEVGDRKRGASIRRSVVLGVIGAVVISGAGYAYASWLSIESAMKLSAAQDETTNLLAQQNEFADVRNLAQLRAAIDDALIVGASTEIDWKSYYEQIVTTLPGDVALDSFVAEASSPIGDLPIATAPTQAPRNAMINFTVSTPQFGSIDAWLKAIKTLPGYLDATASGIALDSSGRYTASVLMNISRDAYSNRYPSDAAAAAEGTPAGDVGTDGTTEGEGTD
jgi:hypothetical protein